MHDDPKTFETILLDHDDRGVATITLNRPEKHHAFNAEMIRELHDAANIIAQDNRTHAVVVQSSGPNFCAGGDLGWMKAQHDADRSGKIAEATKLAMMLKAFHDLPCPLICRVQGNAFGGGLGLMAVADIAVAVDSARFALTETKLGLIPATIGPFVIAKIGGAAARSVFITGSVITATRAKDMGLVSLIAAEQTLDETLQREVKAALHAAPGAMARAKLMLRAITAADLDAQINMAIEHLADCWESDETAAGINAFFNKEKAPWVKS